eukprot:12926753-Prorocentrum_lima.AAC.1
MALQHQAVVCQGQRLFDADNPRLLPLLDVQLFDLIAPLLPDRVEQQIAVGSPLVRVFPSSSVYDDRIVRE